MDKLNQDPPYSKRVDLFVPSSRRELYTSRKREREDCWEADGIATHAESRWRTFN